MPVSSPWGKLWVQRRVATLNDAKHIFSILDVGVGVGTYSDLLRDTLPEHASWTGIEAWEPYVSHYALKAKYNNIIVQDAREISPWFWGMHRLAIFGDVLEHMSHEDAKTILDNRIITKSDLLTLVCVPMLHLEQGAVFDNPYEVHTMENHWSYKEMYGAIVTPAAIAMGKYALPWKLDILRGDVVCYYLLRQGQYAYPELDCEETENGGKSSQGS